MSHKDNSWEKPEENDKKLNKNESEASKNIADEHPELLKEWSADDSLPNLDHEDKTQGINVVEAKDAKEVKEVSSKASDISGISNMIEEGGPIADVTSESKPMTIVTPMGDMTVDQIIVEYDGPRLFTAKDKTGNSWFAVSVDEEDGYESFLWAPVSTLRLNELFSGNLEVREAFKKPEENKAYLVENTKVNDELKQTNKVLASDQIKDEWLPEKGYYLEGLEHLVIVNKMNDKTGLVDIAKVKKLEETEVAKEDSPEDKKTEVVAPVGYSSPAGSLISDSDGSLNKSSKSSEKNGRKGKKIAAFTALAVLIAGGVGSYFYVTEKDNTVVPTAISTVAMGSDISTACDDFKAADLNCSVEQIPSDLVERGSLITQSVTKSEKVKKNTEIVLKYSSGPAQSEFPNLNNKTIDEAKAALFDLNIAVKEIKEVDGKGLEKDRVVSTSVEPGSKIKNGEEVILNVSSGKVKLPNWTDKTREIVEAEAKELGVQVEFKTEESEKASDIVISQTPSAGDIASSSKVQVTISKAFKSKDIKIPDVIGKTAEEAQLELATEGFRHIKTVSVKNSAVTETQVTQVVPGVGQTGKSEENIVIIVSEPDK